MPTEFPPASTIYIRGSMHQNHDHKEQPYIYQTWQVLSIVPKYMGQCIKTAITKNNRTYFINIENVLSYVVKNRMTNAAPVKKNIAPTAFR
jgi:replication initiation and membrane attachment protein DnaB